MSTVAMPEGQSSTTDVENVFRKHSQLIYRTACVVTGSRSDAEDVLQTIFLRLLRRTVPLTFYKNPERYFYKAAVNLSLNTLRSRRRLVLIGDLDYFDAAQSAESSNSDDAIIKRLRMAIATLSPRTVEILILRYVHDYTEAEIATVLGRSRGTIAVTLYRCRVRLRRLLRVRSLGENV